jgi:hypothetical protein
VSGHIRESTGGKTGCDGQELMLKLPVRAQKRKYKREDRMRWARADAEVACQGTEAEVQEEKQDVMDKS